MTWTAVAPDKPGYYWFQDVDNEPLIARVCPNVFDPSSVFDIMFPGEKFGREMREFPFARWAGPISPPGHL